MSGTCRLTVTVVHGRPAAPELAELADELGALLVEAGAPGYEVRDESTLLKPPPGELHVVGWLGPDEAAAVRPRLEAFLAGRGQAGEVRLEEEGPADEAAWRDGWKRYFDVQREGRLVVVPSWKRATTALGPDDLALELDPGRAFGTGAHASTRLCLRALERRAGRAPAPGSVLDVGTGSGILALFAQRLWPGARVVGLDNDPEAVEVARENLEQNRDRFAPGRLPELLHVELDRLPGQFDLVLANLSAPVLGEVGAELWRHLLPGGQLVVSGILAGEADGVLARLLSLAPGGGGRELGRELSEDGWAALELTSG